MRTFSADLKQSDWLTIAGPCGLGGFNLEDLSTWADLLTGRISAMTLTEQLQDRISMSVITLTAEVLNRGLDVIPELTGRDRNRIALTSDLLGLRAMGVSTVLLNRGQLPAGDRPQAHGFPVNPVFETDIAGLIKIAEGLDLDESHRESDWLIGTGFEPLDPPEDWTAPELSGLSGLGASLLLLEPCHDKDRIRRFFGKLVETRQTWNFTTLPALRLFETSDQVRQWKSTAAGQRDSGKWLDRLETASDPTRECLATYPDWIAELRDIPGVDGLHIIGNRNPDLVLELLDLA